jgi:outer membrane murein-binding lipoprotein Lpp
MAGETMNVDGGMPQDERAQQKGARYRDLLAAAERLERESVRLRRQSDAARARAVAARQRADQALVRWLRRRAQ